MDKGRGAPAELVGLLPTHTRVVRIEHEGRSVEVPLQRAERRDGSLAFYPKGTGPFTSNRAARRRRNRG